MAFSEEELERLKKHRDRRKDHSNYISSLKAHIELFSRAVRGHRAVESMHWHLDVTFRKDRNHTLDKITAQTQNIIRKWFNIPMNAMKYLEEILALKKETYKIWGRIKIHAYVVKIFQYSVDKYI